MARVVLTGDVLRSSSSGKEFKVTEVVSHGYAPPQGPIGPTQSVQIVDGKTSDGRAVSAIVTESSVVIRGED